MVDYRSNITGQFRAGFPLTAILAEGAITVADGYNTSGFKEKIATPASPISVGDLVYLAPGTKNTYPATGGLPVVAKMTAGTYYAGIVVSTPEWVKMPSESMNFTDFDNADWAAILAGENYRIATVEFLGITGAMEVEVKSDAAKTVVIGDPTSLKYDVSEGRFVAVGSGGGGSGLVPMHYVPTGNGDLHTIEVGVLATSIVAQA